MKQLCTLLAMSILCTYANAQTDTTKKPTPDTIRIGNIVIIKKAKDLKDNADSKSSVSITVNKPHADKPKNNNVSTNWIILDFGFNNFIDNTNYALANNYLYNRPGAAPLGKSDFALNQGKSLNVNIWLFMQKLNLVQHKLNFKYGLGIEFNNYRYKSNISYLRQNSFQPNLTPSPVVIRDSISFSKNKLAGNYLTIPLMLNFQTSQSKNRGFSISLGVSAGYLYGQRNKQQSDARGKQTNRGPYDLEQFKISYVGEIGMGPVRLYGSYSPKSIYQSGLDMRPFTLGVRFSNW
jgi:Outer membrane protein beta-barrel domain